ncbi:hypothetical protein T484DRAFT_1902972, partial [Baffinella frigidus]
MRRGPVVGVFWLMLAFLPSTQPSLSFAPAAPLPSRSFQSAGPAVGTQHPLFHQFPRPCTAGASGSMLWLRRSGGTAASRGGAELRAAPAWWDGTEAEMMPKEMLERIRREKQERDQEGTWVQRLAERLAPVDDVTRLKLNWVGNIDRHQRQLFWMLLSLLLDRLHAPLRAARALHDLIFALQVVVSRGGALSALAAIRAVEGATALSHTIARVTQDMIRTTRAPPARQHPPSTQRRPSPSPASRPPAPAHPPAAGTRSGQAPAPIRPPPPPAARVPQSKPPQKQSPLRFDALVRLAAPLLASGAGPRGSPRSSAALAPPGRIASDDALRRAPGRMASGASSGDVIRRGAPPLGEPLGGLESTSHRKKSGAAPHAPALPLEAPPLSPGQPTLSSGQPTGQPPQTPGGEGGAARLSGQENPDGKSGGATTAARSSGPRATTSGATGGATGGGGDRRLAARRARAREAHRGKVLRATG